MINMVQNGLKCAHVFKLANVCILKLRYLHQYAMHVKLSYIFGFLTQIQIHTYITHIYQRSMNMQTYPAKIVEQLQKCQFFLLQNLQK